MHRSLAGGKRKAQSKLRVSDRLNHCKPVNRMGMEKGARKSTSQLGADRHVWASVRLRR
jgi:hypothetical protein